MQKSHYLHKFKYINLKKDLVTQFNNFMNSVVCGYVCEAKINIGHYRVLFLGHLRINAYYYTKEILIDTS